ncbi:MAG: glycoside hydrolase family 9 protein [Bryobacteraceae bacterium]
MNRRDFVALGTTAAALWAASQEPDREQILLEHSTPSASPAIVLNHLGFRPEGKKVLIVRSERPIATARFVLREVGSVLEPFSIDRPLNWISSGDLRYHFADFSDVTRAGMYQITVGEERSVPFLIRPDVWRRTLPKAVGYHKYQRCGVEVPNVHPICHLDDARRRDTGEHLDLSGGWHDAGDLRKWMSATMLNAIGLLWLMRNLGSGWDLAGSGLALLHEEVRWGNRYFLKMQDQDGLVFADVAGGVDGDNSDNHWTDNRIGTADDRYLNVSKPDDVQAIFVVLEAMMAQAFLRVDPPYANTCLAAAARCWRTVKDRSASALIMAWWVLASLELWAATRGDEYRAAATHGGSGLLDLQNTTVSGNQRQIRGFWHASRTDRMPFCNALFSALPGIALAQLVRQLPDSPHARRWRDALQMHLDEYVLALTKRSTYGIVPYGIFYKTPTPETYRPLAGDLTYRYFMPTRKESWWLGVNSHLECYAVLLASAAHIFGRRDYRDLAYRQLEWVMGANPFSSCLMTGEGMRNPFPHSRYVGLIPGGIMNGIAGNANDEPILDLSNQMDWRTAEYWSPQNAYYEWAVSALEMSA